MAGKPVLPKLPKSPKLPKLAGAAATAASPLGIASAALSFAPEIFKFFTGMSQRREGRKMNPILPAFQANNALIDNARILGERSNNYLMPGYGTAQQNILENANNSFNMGVQGASSSGDVLDLASKINYGTGQQNNQLALNNANGAQQALNQYLQANAMAGNESVRKNMFDLDQYNQQMQLKRDLMGAGSQNAFSAGDSIADGIRYFTQPQQQIIQPNGNSGFSPLGSIYK